MAGGLGLLRTVPALAPDPPAPRALPRARRLSQDLPARTPALAREPSQDGATVLRGHPARAPGRARPAAAGGPACPAELAPPGGALRAASLLLPVRAKGDQAAHAEDACVLDAGGKTRTGPLSSPHPHLRL